MIKTPLIDKKSICHALIYSTNNPENIIPIKGIVEDIHFKEDIPYYQIKLIKFYDNIFFLKESMIDKPFRLRYDRKPKKIPIPNFKTTTDLQNWFIDECTHRFCVESTMVVRHKFEMIELFNKIQEYLIFKNLREIKNISTRSLYEGNFKISSNIEFYKRLERMYGDKFTNEEYKDIIRYI